MANTVNVLVERYVKHPLYGKIMRRHTKFLAHNENPEIKLGDMVVIEEIRPISKNKHFKVGEILGKKINRAEVRHDRQSADENQAKGRRVRQHKSS